MPSVKDAIRIYNFPQQWSSQLSAIQQRFHYIHIQSGSFDICLEVPARQGPRKIVISIELPHNFPSVSPTLRCKYERHMQIDATTFIIKPTAHAGLEFWNSGNDLSSILHELHTNVFTTNPPIPMSPMWDSTYGSPLAIPLDQIKDNLVLNHIIDSSEPVAHHSSSVAPTVNQPRSNRVEELAVSDFTAMLVQKSLGELETIGKEPHAFLRDCERLTGLRKLETDLPSQYEQINRIEEEAKAAQSLLEEVENVNQVLVARKQELDTKLSSLRSQRQQLDGAFSKQAICDALLSSAQHEELHSEDLGTAFSKGTIDPSTGKPSIDLDGFLSSYLSSRTLYRLRLDKRAVVLSTPTTAGPSTASPPLWTNPQAYPTSSSSSSSNSFSSNRHM